MIDIVFRTGFIKSLGCCILLVNALFKSHASVINQSGNEKKVRVCAFFFFYFNKYMSSQSAIKLLDYKLERRFIVEFRVCINQSMAFIRSAGNTFSWETRAWDVHGGDVPVRV